MLDIDNFITELSVEAPRLALMMRKVVTAVNQTAGVLGIDSTSHASPPDPPQGINVKAANGLAHVTITDNSQRGRSLNYFLEHDTNPAFPAPHVVQLVASRGAFLSLPAKDDGGNAQHWYFRAYSMNPGSAQRSAHVVFGGFATPTAVNVGGSTSLTPLPSTGAGTASTTGQQGGQGFGSAQFAQPETGVKLP
jgi:hypothetical protein